MFDIIKIIGAGAASILVALGIGNYCGFSVGAAPTIEVPIPQSTTNIWDFLLRLYDNDPAFLKECILYLILGFVCVVFLVCLAIHVWIHRYQSDAQKRVFEENAKTASTGIHYDISTGWKGTSLTSHYVGKKAVVDILPLLHCWALVR